MEEFIGMKTMNDNKWEQDFICDTQALIYKYAASLKYNMPAFSDAYLKSIFCERSMDSVYSRFQFADPEECMDFILPEIGEFPAASYFDSDVASWIGWMYRKAVFFFGIKSRDLVQIISFQKMCSMYPGFHTIDEDQAMEIWGEMFPELISTAPV